MSLGRQLVRLAAMVGLVLIGSAGLVGAGFVGAEASTEARLEAGVAGVVVASAAVTSRTARRRGLAVGGRRAVADIRGTRPVRRRPADPRTMSSVLRRGPPAHAPIRLVLA